jgi:NAD(P)-dependent dehydrogenase (short-subunit alcohol dehydrogenase family)
MSTKFTNKLDGQRVLVIGGSTGIGFAVAEAALEHGADVIISSSNHSKIDAAIKRLANHVQKAHLLPVRKISGKVCNLAKPETIEANVKELLEAASQEGKLDHVVFTAGDFDPSPSLDSATVSVISKIGMVRVMGAVFVAKHLWSYMNQSNNSSFTITGTTTDSRPAGAG